MESIDLRRIAENAMQARGLRHAFSGAALQEATMPPGPDAPHEVRDLRHLPWFAIDNHDTLDVDQLSFAEEIAGGRTRVRVAIADVDARLVRGGAVEDHAAANTTSVYTAAGVFPMLPEALSTDLTSLREGEERLAVVVELDVDAEGAVAASTLYRAAVVNRAQLDYDGVAAWLDGRGPAPAHTRHMAALEPQVRLHDAVAQRLRACRERRGALQVKTVSARPVFQDGRLVDLRADEKNRAKDLIADLMIATNAATAQFLGAAGFPSLRRVVEAPRRWDRLVELASRHGTRLPEQPDPRALDGFLRRRRAEDPAGFADLSLRVIKMLGPGEYTALAPGEASPGHFGLAVSEYAHATAPNRRFGDLAIQRLVKAALRGAAAPYTVDELAALARQCTLQEGNANKVERDVLKAAAAYLLQDRIGERFDAIVTGAAPKGTFVRISNPLIEGRLVRGFEDVDVGDTVAVRLAALDPSHSFIDFERSGL
jgi:exoribonuclease-2